MQRDEKHAKSGDVTNASVNSRKSGQQLNMSTSCTGACRTTSHITPWTRPRPEQPELSYHASCQASKVPHHAPKPASRPSGQSSKVIHHAIHLASKALPPSRPRESGSLSSSSFHICCYTIIKLIKSHKGYQPVL